MPFAPTIKSIVYEFNGGQTRETMLTPTASTRVHVVSVSAGFADDDAAGNNAVHIVFGTGVIITTNATKAICVGSVGYGTDLAQSFFCSWDARACPVGDVDEVVSVIGETTTITMIVMHYYETN